MRAFDVLWQNISNNTADVILGNVDNLKRNAKTNVNIHRFLTKYQKTILVRIVAV